MPENSEFKTLKEFNQQVLDGRVFTKHYELLTGWEVQMRPLLSGKAGRIKQQELFLLFQGHLGSELILTSRVVLPSAMLCLCSGVL